MKPVAIFRFSGTEGPGYFGTFLEAHGISWEVIRLDVGAVVPQDLDAWSGFAFMGGPMSANDALPWNALVLQLIRDAHAAGRACIGHCLGGQLMSKALGGVVTRNPVKEIGWQPVEIEESPLARAWLGDTPSQFITYQWHGDTFSIPPGATRILTGTTCVNQAFVIGASLGLQCHTEITTALIENWSQDWHLEGVDESVPSVQGPARMIAEAATHLPALTRVADRLYARWVQGLVSPTRRR